MVNGIEKMGQLLNMNGDKRWWIDGISYTKQEYKYEIRSRKLKQLL